MSTGSQVCSKHITAESVHCSVCWDSSGEDKKGEEDGPEREVQSSMLRYAADASLSVGNMELITNVTETQTNKSSCTDTQTYAAKSRHPVP